MHKIAIFNSEIYISEFDVWYKINLTYPLYHVLFYLYLVTHIWPSINYLSALIR